MKNKGLNDEEQEEVRKIKKLQTKRKDDYFNSKNNRKEFPKWFFQLDQIVRKQRKCKSCFKY